MSLLGVIAEGDSDVAVIQVLLQRVAGTPVRTRAAVADGCGRMQKHALPWSRQLYRQGCTHLMLVCDLDENALSDLSARLTQALQGAPIERRVVVIPVRTIEAWLLADHEAMNAEFRFRPPLKRNANPEGLLRPKERLGQLIEQRSGQRVRYNNRVHNPRIAAHAQVAHLRRCPSFHGFEAFVRENLC